MDDDDVFFDREGNDIVIRRFTAAYESTCPCGATIFEGDLAGYIADDDEASCSACMLNVVL